MSTKKVLVYGGCGALGSTCVNKFKSLNWVNADFLLFSQLITILCDEKSNLEQVDYTRMSMACITLYTVCYDLHVSISSSGCIALNEY